ncbi:MAG: hypothetical protein WA952_13800, partial [Lewinella sp.]
IYVMQKKLVGWQDEMGNTSNLAAGIIRIDTLYQEAMRKFDGALIEDNIPLEDSILRRSGAINYGLRQRTPYGNGAYGLISPQRSVLGKHRSQTAKDLHQIGLITDTVYREVKQLIVRQIITREEDVARYAAERTRYFDEYTNNRAQESRWLSTLEAADVIAREQLQDLTDRPYPSPLLEDLDLLPYTKRGKIFHLRDYSLDPAEGYSRLLAEVAELIPGFEYTDLEVLETRADDNYGDLTAYNLSLAFTAEGQRYRHMAFYNFRRDGEERDTVLSLAAEFHTVFNKYLSDRGTPYRLHLARLPRYDPLADPSIFGVILLTEEQYKTWDAEGRADILSREDFDRLFTSTAAATALAAYDSIGLFRHLSTAEIAAGRACAAESTIETYTDLLQCFPKTIVYFDWETGNLENPYAELTREFAAASRGAFNPVDIQDEFGASWEKEFVTYGFAVGTESYSTELPMEGDWLSSGFLEMITKAMEISGVAGEFHYCLDNGQASGFIYLTEDQFDYLSREQPALFPSY